jgi:hypothetical protein
MRKLDGAERSGKLAHLHEFGTRLKELLGTSKVTLIGCFSIAEGILVCLIRLQHEVIFFR